MTVGPKKKTLSWTEEGRQAFDRVKAAVQGAVVLRFIKPGGRVVLYTDASLYAFGGYLAQDQGEVDEDGLPVLSPISFFSKSFTTQQRNWTVSDKEMFAIFYGVKLYHCLLAGHEGGFEVMSDHSALHFNSVVSASPKIERMKAFLSLYDIKYVFIAGALNVVADGLSRCTSLEGSFAESPEVSNIAQSIEDVGFQEVGFASLSAAAKPHEGLLAYYHGDRGHWQLEATLKMIERDGNQWEGYKEHTAEFISRCTHCEANSPQRIHYHNTPFSLDATAPGQGWSVDTIELDSDSQEYKYALTIIDNFSRWLTIFPLKTMESEEALHWIWHTAMMEGAPDLIRYDSGRGFNNHLFDSINTFLGINGIKTAPGSKEENGIAERANGEIRHQLRLLHQSAVHGNDWSWYCPIVARNHNLKIHSATQASPSSIRFGQWNRASGEAARSHEEIIQFAETNLREKSKKKRRTKHHGERDSTELQPGVWVWRLNPRESKRLLAATPWLGPFLIVGRAGNSLELKVPNKPNEIVNLGMVKLSRDQDRLGS